MKLISITADLWKADGGATFGVVPKRIWQKIAAADENNMVETIDRVLLIDTGDRKVLVDTGMGRKREPKYYHYRCVDPEVTLEKSLLQLHYKPEEITDVIFTHLHDDHVGGSTFNHQGETKLTFPNANYWVSKACWQNVMNPNMREMASYFPDNLLPLKESGKIHLVEQEGALFPDIEIRFFHGHTDGQIIPFIRRQGRTLVFLADFIPSAAHLPLPYVPAFDLQPVLTMKEKQAFFAEAIQNNYILFFQHDRDHECVTLKQTEKGVAVDSVCKLSELPGN